MKDRRVKFILAHSDSIKAILIEMAKSGEPAPEKGTVLGDALQAFTELTDK